MLTQRDIEDIKHDSEKLTLRRFQDAAEEGAFTPTPTPSEDVATEEARKDDFTPEQDDEVAKLKAELKKERAARTRAENKLSNQSEPAEPDESPDAEEKSKTEEEAK